MIRGSQEINFRIKRDLKSGKIQGNSCARRKQLLLMQDIAINRNKLHFTVLVPEVLVLLIEI
jgi:hypothetical protein